MELDSRPLLKNSERVKCFQARGQKGPQVWAKRRPSPTRLAAVLNVGFNYARMVQETGCRAARALY